nr:putative ribonuclease H-like domain-containing protein [Tanacetum cinerariifolium]
MVSSVKLPILKKCEYILWTMKMEQYLAHIDYALWEVILNGNGEVQMTKDEAGNEVEVPPIIAHQILGRTRERKAKSTLLMAIPDEYLARFHGIKDAKTLWDAFKTRFGGNVETKKMQKNKTRRKLEFNGKEPVGFDKTKVECFNCHRRGHFVRDYKIAKNPGNRGRDAGNAGYRGRDNGKRPAREEDEKALVVQDGLGYDSQFNEKEVLDVQEEEVTETVFDNRSSDEENSLDNAKFKQGEGYHAVPHPLTRNYMPPKPDLSFAGLDDSIYKFKISETVTSLTKDVKDALETSTAFVKKPKEVRTSAPLIQECDTNSDNDSVFRPNHIPAKIYFVKADRMAKKSVFPNNVRKGKQHKATCKAKLVSSVSQPLQMLYMDLFGPTSVMSINDKKYCLVVTDDFSRFSWVFFLATKDETSKVLKPFITATENQINKKVKVIRCDNETKFKNRDLNEFCGLKGIKREYSNARTPQQNKVIERNNKTLIEATRTMLADSLLPITFWAEAVNTACYVLNRALVIKPHNKTTYELLNGISHRLNFMRHFDCPVTILNILDPLGKFEGKADDGFWLGNQTDKNAGPQDTYGNKGTQDNVDAGKEHIMLPLWSSISSTYKSSNDKAKDDTPKDNTGSKIIVERINKEDQAYIDELDRIMSQEKEASDAADALRKEFEQGCMDQRGAAKAGSTNSFHIVRKSVNAASTSGTFCAGGPSFPHPDAFIPDDALLQIDQDDSQIHDLEDTTELRSTVQTPGSGISILLAVGTPSTGSGNLYCQWELSPGTSRLDIMFVLCACSRFYVTPKLSHLHAVKRIFRRLISWQCKKQTIVATCTAEVEYVAAPNCCGQVL